MKINATNIFKVPVVSRKVVPEEKVAVAAPKKTEPVTVPKLPEAPPAKGTCLPCCYHERPLVLSAGIALPFSICCL